MSHGCDWFGVYLKKDLHMCDCINTLYDITKIANKIRTKKGLNPLPYQYVYKGWKSLFDSYNGTRNPYSPERKVGVSYTFSNHTAKNIAKKVAEIKYHGNPESITYSWHSRAA
jgi:hypothetical protein